jgi:hypothetical protein
VLSIVSITMPGCNCTVIVDVKGVWLVNVPVMVLRALDSPVSVPLPDSALLVQSMFARARQTKPVVMIFGQQGMIIMLPFF